MTILKPLLSDETIFFLHIHKTGGTSFNALLDQIFSKEEICPYFDDAAYTDLKIKTTQEQRKRFRLFRGHFPHYLIDELPDNLRTVTFLRDPLERTLSAYGEVQKLAANNLIERTELAKLTPEQYIADRVPDD